MRTANAGWMVSLILLSFTAWAQGGLVNPGDLSFIGVNVDGDDNFAVVLLVDASSGTLVRFSDNEWTGSGFNSGEGAVTWTVTSPLSAGTVVTFSNIDSTGNAGFGPSSGTLSGSIQLAVGGETIYAYLGTLTTPTSFLAAISTVSSDYTGGTGTLSGTGLTSGTTAVLLPNGTHAGEYNGTRVTDGSFSKFIAPIGNTNANWSRLTANGQNILPFDVTPFSNPEPASSTLAILAGLGMAGFAYRRTKKS